MKREIHPILDPTNPTSVNNAIDDKTVCLG